jgi:amidase
VLAEAAGVDARPDRFALPLAGVPVAVKDNVPVAGHATRHGSAATSTAPARRDDELVKRLRRAGAVVVGKTRMPELAVWGFTQSALGFTRNPRSPARDPGGSSGGSAAAVAAGMAALALGTDGGGSIRVRPPTAAWSASSPAQASCHCPAARTSTGSGSAPQARSPVPAPTPR